MVLAPNIIMVPPWGYATLELGGFAFLVTNLLTDIIYAFADPRIRL